GVPGGDISGARGDGTRRDQGRECEKPELQTPKPSHRGGRAIIDVRTGQARGGLARGCRMCEFVENLTVTARWDVHERAPSARNKKVSRPRRIATGSGRALPHDVGSRDRLRRGDRLATGSTRLLRGRTHVAR